MGRTGIQEGIAEEHSIELGLGNSWDFGTEMEIGSIPNNTKAWRGLGKVMCEGCEQTELWLLFGVIYPNKRTIHACQFPIFSFHFPLKKI